MSDDEKKQVVSYDFETFYDEKAGYSLSKMPTWQYCTDPRFDAYLVSVCGWNIFGERHLEGATPTKDGSVSAFDGRGSMFRKLADGRQVYVGRPEHFPDYETLRGRHLVAHNLSFERPCTVELVRRGIMPEFLLDLEQDCTADLSAYLMVPRNLKGAMEHLYGRIISKEVRSSMNGRHDYELPPDEYRALVEYGGDDAVECHDIWLDFSDEWPEVERKLSRINREVTYHGIKLDLPKVEEALREMRKYLARVECDIPWAPEKPVGSLPSLHKAVLDMGLTPPSTFKKDSPVFLEWLAEHDDIPFIKARQIAVALAVHMARLQGMVDTVDSRGYSHPVFLYSGSHTLRFSGKSDTGKSAGNLLNLPKKPLFKGDPNVFGGKGVDVRGMYIADPGKVLVIADWSQVEPRITAWLAGDQAIFEAIAREGNLYQANAVAMDWCASGCDLKHTDPDLYKIAKASSIGSTYGLGAVKFVDYCKGMGFDLPAIPYEKWPGEFDRRTTFILRNVGRIKGSFNSPRNREKVGQILNAIRIIDDWRRANPKIVDMWKRFENIFKSRVSAGKETVAYRLPGGYVKRYYNPCLMKEPVVEIDEEGREHPGTRIAMSAQMRRGDPPKFLTGGAITENLVQTFGRILLGNVIVEMQEKYPRWRYVMSVYDEVVLEAPEDEADDCLAALSHVMCHGDRIASFTEGLPLEVEGTVSKCYCK